MARGDPPGMLDEPEGRQLLAYDESTPLVRKHEAPRDKFWLTYWITFLFGIVSLLPWYVFPVVDQYFRLQLTEHHNLAKHIVNYVAIASQVPAALILPFNTYIIERVPEFVRIMVSLSIVFLMFAVNMVLAWLDTTHYQLTFFVVTISSVFVINTASCVFQGGVFALGARFPPAYRQSIMSGQGLGGLLAASSNLVSLLVVGGPNRLTPAQLANGAIGYFLTAMVVTLLAMGGYLLMGRLEFASQFPTCVLLRRLRKQSWAAFFSDLRRILKKMGHMAMVTFLCFMVSLSLFPGVTAKIHSVDEDPLTCSNGNISNGSVHMYSPFSAEAPTLMNESMASDGVSEAWVCTYFQPVTCFLLFQIMNFLGRTSPGKVQIPGHRYLLVPSVARISLIGLYVFCKYSLYHQPYFTSDAAPIILMVFLGFSNGYFTSLAFIYAPTLVDEEDAETAGAIMAASEGVGSLVGVVIALGLTDVYTGPVQDHMPFIT